MVVYVWIYSHWIDPEIRDLKDQQQRCLSRIDDLEDQHQSNRSTLSNPQSETWNQMRQTINEEARKEIEFLETKKQESATMYNRFKALKNAKDSGTLPADEWREKLKDLAKRDEDLKDELRRRKRLILDVCENGRRDVTCTREDFTYQICVL